MKKILFIHHAGTIGGAPWSLLYTIKALDPTKYSARVLFLEPGKVAALFDSENIPWSKLHHPGRFKGNRRFVHIEPAYLKWYQFIPILKMFWWCHRVSSNFAPVELKLHDFDILHLNSISLIDWAKAAKLQGKKVIMHVREPLASGLIGIRRKFIRQQIKNYCDRVIAISHDNASRVNLPEICTVVYNFSDFNDFNLQVDPLLEREKGCFYLLYMGGAKKFKGYELLAKSINKVNQEVRIIFAGNYVRLEKTGFIVSIKRFLNRLFNGVPDFRQILDDPRVVFVGLSTEVPPLIQSCDAVLFPATKSHFPRPLIEGMAMKKMALAFNTAGIDEVVKHEKNGLVISRLTPAGLARGINQLAAMSEERHREMSEFGYQFARSNFSVQNIEQITKIYEEL